MAADGSWAWGPARLAPDQVGVADDGYDRFRAAEGRDLFGSYVGSGLTTKLRQIEERLEHGSLDSHTEDHALLDIDVFRARFAEMLRRHPDRSPDMLAKRVPGALSYAFIFGIDYYADGIEARPGCPRGPGLRAASAQEQLEQRGEQMRVHDVARPSERAAVRSSIPYERKLRGPAARQDLGQFDQRSAGPAGGSSQPEVRPRVRMGGRAASAGKRRDQRLPALWEQREQRAAPVIDGVQLSPAWASHAAAPRAATDHEAASWLSARLAPSWLKYSLISWRWRSLTRSKFLSSASSPMASAVKYRSLI